MDQGVAEQLDNSAGQATFPTRQRPSAWAATPVGIIVIVAGILSCLVAVCVAVCVLGKRSGKRLALRTKSRDTLGSSASSFDRSVTPASGEPPPSPEGVIMTAIV